MANNITEIKVELAEKSYPIITGWGILPMLGEQLLSMMGRKKILIISNPLVFGLYGETLVKSMEAAGFTVSYALIPDGEEAKSLETAAKVYGQCCQAGLERRSVILALGGGVAGDLAGFIAATFMRGVSFVQVPTTLLAQVDSSVGGKVGINLPEGKNLVGAFYQPKLVYMDLQTLTTLPVRELRTGIAEIIKYGVLEGEEFFSYLEDKIELLLKLDREALHCTVIKSCLIKSGIVSQDEQEGGLRAVLNFGHSIGHAIEALSEYQQFRHGEAVAIGMKYAGRIALKLNWWSAQNQERLEKLIGRVGLPQQLPGYSAEELLKAMALDKKNIGGKLTLVLPEKIGRVKIVPGVDSGLVKEALAE
jgi:3-dehydroquinate synthase